MHVLILLYCFCTYLLGHCAFEERKGPFNQPRCCTVCLNYVAIRNDGLRVRKQKYFLWFNTKGHSNQLKGLHSPLNCRLTSFLQDDDVSPFLHSLSTMYNRLSFTFKTQKRKRKRTNENGMKNSKNCSSPPRIISSYSSSLFLCLK